jgi:hypothetical protein
MLYCMHGCHHTYKQRLTKNGFIGIACACSSYVIPKINLLHIDKLSNKSAPYTFIFTT